MELGLGRSVVGINCEAQGTCPGLPASELLALRARYPRPVTGGGVRMGRKGERLIQPRLLVFTDLCPQAWPGLGKAAH